MLENAKHWEVMKHAELVLDEDLCKGMKVSANMLESLLLNNNAKRPLDQISQVGKPEAACEVIARVHEIVGMASDRDWEGICSFDHDLEYVVITSLRLLAGNFVLCLQWQHMEYYDGM